MGLLDDLLPAPGAARPERHDPHPAAPASADELRAGLAELAHRINDPLRELAATVEQISNVRTIGSSRARWFSTFVPSNMAVRVLPQAIDRARFTLLPIVAGSSVWLGSSQSVGNRGGDSAQLLGGLGLTLDTRDEVWAIADATLSPNGLTLSFVVEQWDANP